jgi:hypothetical protein
MLLQWPRRPMLFVFVHSNTGIVGLNLAQGMGVCIPFFL